MNTSLDCCLDATVSKAETARVCGYPFYATFGNFALQSINLSHNQMLHTVEKQMMYHSDWFLGWIKNSFHESVLRKVFKKLLWIHCWESLYFFPQLNSKFKVRWGFFANKMLHLTVKSFFCLFSWEFWIHNLLFVTISIQNSVTQITSNGQLQ